MFTVPGPRVSVPAFTRLLVVANEAPPRICKLPPAAILARWDRLLKLAPIPLMVIVAASVVMLAPSDIELLAPTLQVAPVRVPEARLDGAVLIVSEPPRASTLPAKVLLPLN